MTMQRVPQILEVAALAALCWMAPAPAAAAAPVSPTPYPTPAAATVRLPDRVLAEQAWQVLKASLVEESLKEKYADFSEGAGGETLKKLSPSSYVALMADLARSPQARVRRRAVASLTRWTGPAARGVLKRALRDRDLSVRMEAAGILGERGDKTVLPVYRKALHTASRDGRYVVLQSLKRIPHKWIVNELRAFLKDRDPFVRVAACEALCRLGDEKAFMTLRKAMRNQNKYLRSNAYAVVKDAAGERVVPMLTKALKDKDASIRLFAAVNLARMNSARGLPVLKAALHQGTPNIRFTVVDSLAMLRDRRAVPLLGVALKDADVNVAVRAAEALFARGNGSGAAVVRRALQGKTVALRLRAVAAARAAATRAGASLLQAALADRSRLVRLAAVDALSALPEVGDRAALRAALRDGDRSVRVAAAILMVRLGDRDAAETLRGFVQDGAPEREEAARALEHVTAAEVVPYLQILATHGSDSDRLRAVRALGHYNVGPAAEALSAIARSDAGEALRIAAVEALGGIRGDLATYLLKGLLQDKTPAVQYAAAALLGDRGVSTAVPVLKQAVAENNVRAARALCKMGDAAGVTVYRQVLTAPDLGERIEAAVVLYRLEKAERLGAVSTP